jgi:DNA invertase Pin-like site-specific DNA recombinase
LAAAQAHAYDVLVVHKLDRFSRNLRVTLESLDTLGKAGVAFASVTEQIDFTTPWGRLSLTMLGGLAQFYSDNLAQETKKGKGERKAQGLYNGILPFGVMKGPYGVPKPHDEVWHIRDKSGNVVLDRPPTHDGLLQAFDPTARGPAH